MGKHAAMHYNSYACILHVLSIETFSYAKCVINMYIMSKGIHICQYIYYNCNSYCETPKKSFTKCYNTKTVLKISARYIPGNC